MASATATTGRLATFLAFVKFEHTLFALPFAYGGMLLAAGGWPGWRAFLLVTVAMVGARTAAMAANRVIDARLDAVNPRTSGREIPTGRLSERDGWVVTVLSLIVLGVAAAAGGFIAVTGAFAAEAWALWLAVAAWVAGFDIVYGLLDLEFDRQHGVRSVPATFGVAGALGFAAALHALALAAFAALPFLTPLGWPYWLALAVTAALLVWQHLSLRRRAVGDVLAAFNANLVIGTLMLAGIVLGQVTRG